MLALQRLMNEMTQEQRQALEDRRQERAQLRAMFNFDILNQAARTQADQHAAAALATQAQSTTAQASKKARNG